MGAVRKRDSSESADSSSADASDLEVSAFAGTTDDGKYIVQYVEMNDSDTQTSLATLLFEDINTGECKQYTGEVSIDDDGAIVIDSVDDEKIHFMMSASEDSDTIDVVFENYGTAKVAPGDPDAIRDGIDEAMDKASAEK